MDELLRQFKRAVWIMDRLRSPKGCPWDREQDVDTLKKYIIEEAYELVEALESGKVDHIVEELGDLFFQVLFQSRLGKEGRAFDLKDVIAGLNEKMTRRHPHVFGKERGIFKDSREVLVSWSGTKRKEGKRSAIDGIPKKLPSLLKAYRITEKAASVGFDWRKKEEILDKLKEETGELKREFRRKCYKKEMIADEIGDILFTVVNISRFLKIDPDHALRRTIDKFGRRFRHIERRLGELNIDVKDAGIDNMERFWQEAKAKKIR